MPFKLLFLCYLLSLTPKLIAQPLNCGDVKAPWISLTSGNLTLNAHSEPAQIKTSETFNLILSVCNNNQPYIGTLKFDARMPQHKHAMNYQPRVINQNDGHYLIQGNLLHMPGLWRFSFTLDSLKQPLFFHYELP